MMKRLVYWLSLLLQPRKLVDSIILKMPRLVADKTYIECIWRSQMNYPLNLSNPRTFNEKLQWLKLYDRKPIYTLMVDKYAVKKYVADIIGEKYIIPTLGVWDKPEDIDWDALPYQFVLKCTHDSGGIVICRNKDILDKKSAMEKLRESLKSDYYLAGREWPYKNVPRRIIAEKYMDDGTGELNDYKFMCYNGVCKNLFVCTGRAENDLKVDFFDLEWNHLPFIRKYPNSSKRIPKPDNLNDMVRIVESISRKSEIPFARIDLYNIRNMIYFGEITLFPGNGIEYFNPQEWDYKLGEMINLPHKTK